MADQPTQRSPEEVARQGEEIYETKIRESVEEEHHGMVVAIDVNTGEYEIGKNALEAGDLLFARLPNAEIWFVRVGFSAMYRIGRSHCRARP